MECSLHYSVIFPHCLLFAFLSYIVPFLSFEKWIYMRGVQIHGFNTRFHVNIEAGERIRQVILFSLLTPGTKSRASCMLFRSSTTELYLRPKEAVLIISLVALNSYKSSVLCLAVQLLWRELTLARLSVMQYYLTLSIRCNCKLLSTVYIDPSWYL